MGRKRTKRGQGSIYERNGLWWCDYSVDGVRKRESCQTANRDEALAYLHRKQGKLASGELLTPDRVSVRDLLKLLLEDYEVRTVAQGYIATLKVKAILLPKLGDIKATKLSSARIKEYIETRLKTVKPGTVNRELGLLHRAFQLGYNQDPPLVARVPQFPKLTEDISAAVDSGVGSPQLFTPKAMAASESEAEAVLSSGANFGRNRSGRFPPHKRPPEED
jgi:hypothetical protein